MRNFHFKPVELNRIKQEIVQGHRKAGLYTGKDNYNEEFYHLLMNIVSMKENKLKSFAQKISRDNLNMLASYMPYNDYNVNMDNIMTILDVRFRKEYLDASYRAYQETLGNSDYNQWMYSKLSDNLEYSVRERVKGKTLRTIFRNDDAITYLVSQARNENYVFEDLRKIYAIRKSSKMAVELIQQLLIDATREQYLSMTSEELIQQTASFTNEDMGRLLDNYLEKLDLNVFHEIFLNNIHKIYEAPKHSKSSMWHYVDDNQKMKFIKWLSLKQISEIFGNDERTVFWKKYLNNVKASYMNADMKRLALDFGQFVIIEFQKVGNATYIYAERDYYKEFNNYFHRKDKHSTDMLKDQNLSVSRLTHNGNWQSRFSRELNRLGIRR
jgi:hypothetical protein